MTEMNANVIGAPTVADLDEMFTDATGPDFVELTALHRCDRCTAAAIAQVEISDTLPHLLLCGHHWRVHLPFVTSAGYAYTTGDEHDDDGFPLAPQNTLRDAGSATA